MNRRGNGERENTNLEVAGHDSRKNNCLSEELLDSLIARYVREHDGSVGSSSGFDDVDQMLQPYDIVNIVINILESKVKPHSKLSNKH